MILRDRYLLPCASGEPSETLNRYLPGAPAEMNLRLSIQDAHWVGGWDMVRGLPRAPRLAVRQGSVWVYSVPNANLSDAIAWWVRAQRDGLGELRGQGFGRVRLLHPLHAEERDRW
jgi:hypothetical protein